MGRPKVTKEITRNVGSCQQLIILSQFLTRDKRGEVTILLLMWPTISMELQDTKIYIYTFFPIYFLSYILYSIS